MAQRIGAGPAPLFFQGTSPQARLSGWERVRWGQGFEDVLRNYPQAGEKNGGLLITPDEPVQRPWTITLRFDTRRQRDSVTLSCAGGVVLSESV